MEVDEAGSDDTASGIELPCAGSVDIRLNRHDEPVGPDKDVGGLVTLPVDDPSAADEDLAVSHRCRPPSVPGSPQGGRRPAVGRPRGGGTAPPSAPLRRCGPDR